VLTAREMGCGPEVRKMAGTARIPKPIERIPASFSIAFTPNTEEEVEELVGEDGPLGSDGVSEGPNVRRPRIRSWRCGGIETAEFAKTRTIPQ